HLHLNHKTRWEEYQGLAHQEKSKYFDVAVKHAETICHYIEPRSEAITLIVSSSIVDIEDGSNLVEITKSKQFLLAMRYVGRGMSFAMATNAIHDAKEVCDIPKLGACSDYLVASYARVACAFSIKHISQVPCNKWAFSNSALENLHLITLPFVGRHTSLATSEMFKKLFDVVCPLWKDKLIGCSTDGAANMTRRLSRVVTQIQNVVYKRVGCNFYKTLTSIISFLRRQKNLKRSEIVTYFVETEPSDRFDQLPTPAFWILISVISEISTHISECVESLQGWRRFAFVELTLDDDTLPAVSYADLRGFIQDHGIFASQILDALKPEECTEVLDAIGEILLLNVNRLSSVEALRDEVNNTILKFHDRLSVSLTQNSIDFIVDQQKKLLNAVKKEPRLQTALARHSEQTDFNDAWNTPSIKDRFPELMEFCGGLASPFHNTATIESDFSHVVFY
ncbi:hypothetical protein CY35_04G122900, partial [Sphagnum magellanicum]